MRDLELGNDLFFSLSIFTSWYEVSQAIIFMCVSKKFNLLFTHSLHSDLLDKDFCALNMDERVIFLITFMINKFSISLCVLS